MRSGGNGRLGLDIADLFQFVAKVRRKEFLKVGVLGVDAPSNLSLHVPPQVYVNLFVESMTTKPRYLVEFLLGLRAGLEG